VEENTTAEERSGTITFISATGGLIATLDVTQLAGSGITLSDTQQAVSFDFQTRDVTLSTDLLQSWVWDSDSDWLTAPTQPTTQTGTQIFTYQVEQNSTGAARTGNIIFKTISGDITTTLTVTQFGDAAFSLGLSADQQALSYEGQSNEVKVISNTDWTWESNADWINSAELLNQNGIQDFTYSTLENTTGEARTGSITFKTTEGDVTAILTVTQLGRSIEELVLNSIERSVGASSGQFYEVTVLSNTAWSWTSSTEGTADD